MATRWSGRRSASGRRPKKKHSVAFYRVAHVHDKARRVGPARACCVRNLPVRHAHALVCVFLVHLVESAPSGALLCLPFSDDAQRVLQRARAQRALTAAGALHWMRLAGVRRVRGSSNVSERGGNCCGAAARRPPYRLRGDRLVDECVREGDGSSAAAQLGSQRGVSRAALLSVTLQRRCPGGRARPCSAL